MTYIGNKKYNLEVARGNVGGVSNFFASGFNLDIDTGASEDLWGGAGSYTGFDATAGEAIEVLTASGQNVGTVLISGTATGGTSATIVDTGETFQTNIPPVAVGDLVVNDTQKFHGIVTSVDSETQLTVARWEGDNVYTTYAFESGDDYRIITTGGTGAACFRLSYLLESDRAEYITEYVVPNGATAVDTTGTDYIRCGKMEAVLCGSGGAVDTAAQARQTTTTANVFVYIDGGNNKSGLAGGTVPDGKVLEITDLIASIVEATGATAIAAECNFVYRDVNGFWKDAPLEYLSESNRFHLAGNNYVHPIPPMSDFIFRVPSVSDDNTIANAQIIGYLYDL